MAKFRCLGDNLPFFLNQNLSWGEWSTCDSDLIATRTRNQTNQCHQPDQMVTKKGVTCLEPEVDSQNCADFCSAPLWSDWVKVNECKMVRFCETKGWSQKNFRKCVGVWAVEYISEIEKVSTKRCPPCPGPSEKEIPCTMATFCGKKVQLSNVRARFMSVKPGKEFKIAKILSTRGATVIWRR